MIGPLSLKAALEPSRFTFRYADIDDDNAIITSIATAVTIQTYTAAGLTGVLANPGPALTKMHAVSVTTAANPGTYIVGSTVVITGRDQEGGVRTLTATIAATNGGEVLDAVDANDNIVGVLSVDTVVAAAQNDINGAFEVGVTDVVFDTAARQVRCGAAGNIGVEYEHLYDGTTALIDTLTGIEGERHDVYVKKILDTGTSAFPVTAYV